MMIKWYDKLNPAHVHMLTHLLKQREMPAMLMADLPATGLIAFNDIRIPIAAAFLRLMEGSFAVLDGYISSPDQPQELRDEALDEMTRKLVKFAKDDLRLTSIFCFSSCKAIYKRAMKHEFLYDSKMKVFSMNLNGGGIWPS